jgi:hypothetical protein
MGISQFPPASSGGLSNDFIVDRNNTNNTTFALPREFEAGGYALTTSTNDSSFDVYLLNAAGSSIGYTNGSSIVASESFDTVVIYGLSTAANVQFSYRGPSTNATSTGTETGAGAFLTSVSPADLPNVDDTATVAGGNFASNVAITFESGTVVLPAKNVVVGSSTALVITRPDNLIQDNAPYNLRAVNPGITQPTGSNANILSGTITAGADPTFVTPALITGAATGVAFSTSILVSDSDGTVINWAITAGTIPPGLSLATATGAISGTPTTSGDYFFTVRITDDGQNTNSREFNLPVGFQIAGGNGTVSGGTAYYWWTTSGTAIYKNASSTLINYVTIAGGGGGGNTNAENYGGAGGAGGLLAGSATLSGAGTVVMTIGGGGSGSNGTNSVFTSFATATGGGKGGNAGQFGNPQAGSSGGSGGGGGGANSGGAAGGAGTSGQGNAGGSNETGDGWAGGGGGRGTAGSNQNAGNGVNTYSAWASAINIIHDSGFFAGGGAGRRESPNTTYGSFGSGGGGRSGTDNGATNSGGGGSSSGQGGSGLIMVRVG